MRDVPDWEESVAHTALTLAMPETTTLPYPAAPKTEEVVDEAEPAEPETPSKKKAKPKAKSKRKAAAEADDGDDEAAAKKAKTDGEANGGGVNGGAVVAVDPVMAQQAALAASFFGALDPESLKMPTLPSKEEMGKVLLEVRKKALRDEYGV